MDKFIEAMNQVAKAALKAEHLLPSLDIDAVVNLSDLNEKLISELESLEPFGAGNDEPLFCSRNLKVKDRACLLKSDTLKFWVTDGALTCCAIGYRMKEYLSLVSKDSELDLVYIPRLDLWQGNKQITLEIQDIKASSRS